MESKLSYHNEYIYRDNGKENGNYKNGAALGLGFRV